MLVSCCCVRQHDTSPLPATWSICLGQFGLEHRDQAVDTHHSGCLPNQLLTVWALALIQTLGQS